MKSKEVVVLFSGGTDSTLTAALMAEQFEKVHLLTYSRFGFFSVNNTNVNVQKLKDKYGQDKFTHVIVSVEKLTRHVFYERYLHNLFHYGFFLLSVCGLCKLAMHVRTVIFCLDNNIPNICDGANQGMYLFPDQMRNVILDIRRMYSVFGIQYSNPVFDFEGPQDIDFADRLHCERLLPPEEHDAAYFEKKKKTTGCRLFELGLMPSDNVKGTPLDRSMQPRCFQFILFNIFLHWYYLCDHSYEQYCEMTELFFKEKINVFTVLLNEFKVNEKKSKLFHLCEDRQPYASR